MVDDGSWPKGLFPRVAPEFRDAVYRKTMAITVPGTMFAVLMSMLAHIVLDALGLLPYPMLPAAAIGAVLSTVLAASILWTTMRYVAIAHYHLEAKRDEFERLSRTDTLTGLLNRRAFVQAFHDTPKVAALALFDIDHFKKVNDRFGHGGGDAALVEVSRALGEGFAAPDVVARIGGEEFAVLVASCAGDAATALVERVRRTLGAQRIAFETHEFSVTASAGIAHAGGEDGDDIDALLLAADRALYLAKAQGRDRLIDAGGLAVLRPPADRPSASGITRQRRKQQA